MRFLKVKDSHFIASVQEQIFLDEDYMWLVSFLVLPRLTYISQKKKL